MQNVLRSHENAVRDGRKKGAVCGMTVEGVIRSPNSLMVVGMPGDWQFTPMTRTNREIFRLFGLEEPKSGRMVMQ